MICGWKISVFGPGSNGWPIRRFLFDGVGMGDGSQQGVAILGPAVESRWLALAA